jgi:hypothetical protein
MSDKKTELEIEISENGDIVTFHIQGISGKQCIDATELFEKGLGVVLNRKLTQEYHKIPEKKVVNTTFGKTNN